MQGDISIRREERRAQIRRQILQELLASRRKHFLNEASPQIPIQQPLQPLQPLLPPILSPSHPSLTTLLRRPTTATHLNQLLYLLTSDQFFSSLTDKEISLILELGLENFSKEEGQLLVMAAVSKGIEDGKMVVGKCVKEIGRLQEGDRDMGEGYVRIMRVMAQDGVRVEDFKEVVGNWRMVVGKLGVTSNFISLISHLPSIQDIDLLSTCLNSPIPSDNFSRQAMFSLVSSCVGLYHLLPELKLFEWSWTMINESDPYTRKKGLRNLRMLLKDREVLAQAMVNQGFFNTLLEKVQSDRVSLRQDYFRVIKMLVRYSNQIDKILEVVIDIGLNSEDSNIVDESFGILSEGLCWHREDYIKKLKVFPHFEYTLESLCYHKDSDIFQKANELYKIYNDSKMMIQ